MDATAILSLRREKISWPKGPLLKQQFCIPDALIYYITKNPSLTPILYSKLTHSCKYFFEKIRILVVARIFDGGKEICSSINAFECEEKKHKCCVKADIAKIKVKIWLTDEIHISGDDNLIIAYKTILPKLYRYENAQLDLYSKKISWLNFKCIAPKFQKISLSAVQIFDSDKNIVMFETILEALPNAKEFVYGFYPLVPNATTSTMRNILKLKTLDNLRYLHLINVPETFDVKDLGDFIADHKDIKTILNFFFNVSQEYKSQLNDLIDIVTECEISNCLINYRGQDDGKLKLMENQFDR